MKTKLSQLTQWLLTAVIALLGFSACEDKDRPIMYGSPTADYKAEGVVTDEDGNPIEGIQIKVEAQTYIGQTVEPEVVYSSSDGLYTTKKYKDRPILYLHISDIDGEKNGGEFEEMTINLQELKPVLDKTDADGWYIGVYNYVVNFKLTKKSADNE